MDLNIINSIGPALTGIKALTDLVSTIKDSKIRVELNSKIADLQGSLLNARQQLLTMQEQYEAVLKENRELKQLSLPREKPTLKFGCYKFEGEEGLFCPACYDSKGKKFRAARMNSRFYQCTVCKAQLA